MIRSDAGGIRVDLVGSATPVFSQSETEAKTAVVYTDPETLLKSQLPGTVELSEVVNELKSFEGAWHTCYPGLSAYELTQPLFNAKGDLLFKLRPFGVVPRALAKPVPASVGTTTTTAASGVASRRTTIIKTRPSLHSQHSRTSCK